MRASSSPARRFRVELGQPLPITDRKTFWSRSANAALIGIFLLAALATLQYSRALLLPVTLAIVLGTMLAPLAERAGRARVPPPVSAFLLVAAFIALLSFVILVLSGFVTEWMRRGPEIGTTLQQKLQLLDRPLAALRDLQQSVSGPLGIDLGGVKFDLTSNVVTPVLAVLTPAVSQLLLFFGTLFFFLSTHQAFRRRLIALPEERRERLRALRVYNDIERNLSNYVGILTLINIAVGVLVAIEAAIIGLPNPVALGVLAFGLNYIPIIGPGLMTVILFVVGLVAFPSLSYALIAPLIFVAQAALEGNFITPSIVGRQMTVNPFAIFLSIAFWVWLWGPLASFLAMPILIVLMVLRAHFYARPLAE